MRNNFGTELTAAYTFVFKQRNLSFITNTVSLVILPSITGGQVGAAVLLLARYSGRGTLLEIFAFSGRFEANAGKGR